MKIEFKDNTTTIFKYYSRFNSPSENKVRVFISHQARDINFLFPEGLYSISGDELLKEVLKLRSKNAGKSGSRR